MTLVDICITTTLKDLEKVCLLANALAESMCRLTPTAT